MLSKEFFILSHQLNEKTPAYGGRESFSRKSLSTISQNNHANSEEWKFKNHLGTHIDFPLHFFADGKSLSDFQCREFYFEKAFLIDLPAKEDEIISAKKLPNIPIDCEILYIRTGFEQKRFDEAYWNHNPGLDPELAGFLKQKAPKIRAVGFDFISLSAFQKRDLGRDAHRAFLSKENNILIIEDVRLAECQHKEFSCIVAPLLVEGADGSPVTIFGFK